MPKLIEIFAERGRIGKSFTANHFRDFFEMEEVPWDVRVVRVESREGRPAARVDDPRIYLTDIDEAKADIGGEVTAFGPLWEALNECGERGAVILDWPAGVSELRARTLAYANVARLQAIGFDCLTVVVSTADATVLEQAAASVAQTNAIAPTMPVVALINELTGPAARAPRGSDRHRAYIDLVKLMGDRPILTMPVVPQRAWEAFEAHGLEMPAVLAADLDSLAAEMGSNTFVVEAFRVMVAGWWQRTDRELRRIFANA